MKVTLKNINIAKAMSEETLAYTADLYVDGVKTAHAINHGNGGSDLYRPVDAIARDRLAMAERFFAGRKTVVCGQAISDSLELEVSQLLDRHESKAQIRRRMRSSVLMIEGGKLMELRMRSKPSEDVVRQVGIRYPDATILNGMDIEEVVDLVLAVD